MKQPGPGDALLVVDVQNDFMPGGALGIRHGDEILAPINRLIDRCSAAGLPVLLTRDWHPPDHCSFAAQGGPWPEHCVAGSPGARFVAQLHVPAGALLVSKATQRNEEAYSAFHGTGLAEDLRRQAIRRVFIAGLATDYCVRASTADARRAGFDVVVLTDAIRAVDAQPGDAERAIEEMTTAGAAMITSSDLLDLMQPSP
jgi:nicotinamidase/pyrazinamidase